MHKHTQQRDCDNTKIQMTSSTTMRVDKNEKNLFLVTSRGIIKKQKTDRQVVDQKRGCTLSHFFEPIYLQTTEKV